MGKKGGDAAAAKAKKARKQEDLKRALLAQQALKEMEKSTPNLLAALPSFHHFRTPALDLTLLSVPSPSHLPAPTAAALFELTAANMAPVYAASGFGWDPAAKARELRDEAARFLLAYETKDVVGGGEGAASVPGEAGHPNSPPLPPTASPVAFVHYRLVMEAGEATLYVYEIQLAPSVRRHGLGRFLMTAVEAAAGRGGLARVMLTVQAGNTGAASLYERLGYATDASSPGPGEGPGGGEPGYRILVKRLQEGGEAAAAAPGSGGAASAADGAVEVVSGGGGGEAKGEGGAMRAGVLL